MGVSMLIVPQLAAAAAFLFVSFALAVGANLLRGRTELRCGCFGATGERRISWAHVAGNACLTLVAALSFFAYRRPSFLAFQVGVSAVLLVLLASAWRTMAPQPRGTVEEAEEARES